MSRRRPPANARSHSPAPAAPDAGPDDLSAGLADDLPEDPSHPPAVAEPEPAPVSALPVLRPGDLVGRYRLIRRLGRGAFATVWLGYDDDLAVPVAVKVLDERWVANPDVRQRFVTEARLMRRIRDERVTHVYDIGYLSGDQPYFVMDFADGGSLADLDSGPRPPVQALRLAAEACRAIGALHEHDVVHRDVTPGNLLLGHARSGRTQVLVADLGVAKDLAAVVGLPAAAGTPAFMAPEQARGEHLDHRADLYAVAAVCYLLLSGRPPYRARTLEEVLERAPDARPDPLADRLGTPPMLDVLLAAGLATDPNRRPPTAALFADALDRIADDLAPEPEARAEDAHPHPAPSDGADEAAQAHGAAGADASDGGHQPAENHTRSEDPEHTDDPAGRPGADVEVPSPADDPGRGSAADGLAEASPAVPADPSAAAAGAATAPTDRTGQREPPTSARSEDEPVLWRGQATMIRPLHRPLTVPTDGSDQEAVPAGVGSDQPDTDPGDADTTDPVLPRPLPVYLLWVVLGLVAFSVVLLGLTALLR